MTAGSVQLDFQCSAKTIRETKNLFMLKFREATKADVIEIVKMLADDPLGKSREDYREPLPELYYQAFESIDANPYEMLMVVEDEHKAVIGSFQLSFIQYLNRKAGLRAQIESVRVRKDQRGKGIGEKMFRWAIEKSKERGAMLLQLTSDKKRPDAIRFYEKLGFVASHEGFKLKLL